MAEIESAEVFATRTAETRMDTLVADIRERDAAVRKQALLDAAEIAYAHVVRRDVVTTAQRHANMAALEITRDIRALIGEEGSGDRTA